MRRCPYIWVSRCIAWCFLFSSCGTSYQELDPPASAYNRAEKHELENRSFPRTFRASGTDLQLTGVGPVEGPLPVGGLLGARWRLIGFVGPVARWCRLGPLGPSSGVSLLKVHTLFFMWPWAQTPKPGRLTSLAVHWKSLSMDLDARKLTPRVGQSCRVPRRWHPERPVHGVSCPARKKRNRTLDWLYGLVHS